MKKWILIYHILFLSVLSASAQKSLAPDDLFNQAFKYFKDGKYSKALSAYDGILNAGFVSPEVHYNMGNIYYKQDSIADAIYHFEKANYLDPANADIQHNLGLANARQVDDIDKIPEFFLVAWYRKIVYLLESNLWAYIAIGLFWLSALALLVYIIRKNINLRRLAIAIAVLAFLCTAFSFSSYIWKQSHKYAIIFAQEAELKNNAAYSSEALLKVHKGLKVKIEDGVDLWIKVKLSDGTIGWLEKKDLKII